MKQIFLSFAFIFMTLLVAAQVTDPNKVIKLGNEKELKGALSLEDGKQYAFLAGDMQELFPSLVKGKKVSERFGKNAYRTKTVKVIDETQLMATLISALKNQSVEIQDLKRKLVTIETKM